MKTMFTAVMLILSFSLLANDSKECTGEQVIGYGVSSTVVEFSGNSRLISLQSGSSRDLYVNIKAAAIDSSTLGSVSADVKDHFTKKAENITCFKQEIQVEGCATYSCNFVIRE